MQEPRRDTKGLGDRVAALLNAAAIAVRFRRKLIIQSSDGFDTLFVPHRADYAAGMRRLDILPLTEVLRVLKKSSAIPDCCNTKRHKI